MGAIQTGRAHQNIISAVQRCAANSRFVLFGLGHRPVDNGGLRIIKQVLPVLRDNGIDTFGVELDQKYQERMDKFVDSGDPSTLPASLVKVGGEYLSFLNELRTSGFKVLCLDYSGSFSLDQLEKPNQGLMELRRNPFFLSQRDLEISNLLLGQTEKTAVLLGNDHLSTSPIKLPVPAQYRFVPGMDFCFWRTIGVNLKEASASRQDLFSRIMFHYIEWADKINVIEDSPLNYSISGWHVTSDELKLWELLSSARL